MLSMSSGEKPQQQRLLDEEAGRSDDGDHSSARSSMEASWNNVRQNNQNQSHGKSQGPKKWFYKLLSVPRRYRILFVLAAILTILIIWATPYRPAAFDSKHHANTGTDTSAKAPTSSSRTLYSTPRPDAVASTALNSSPSAITEPANGLTGTNAATPTYSQLPASTGKEADVPNDGLPVKPWRNETSTSAEYCTTWPLDEEGGYIFPPKPSEPLSRTTYAPQGGWKKPKDVKVVAMVFYGRLRNVDILDCYLQQNLALNGGFLDEVWFMVHTSAKDDVDWLRELTGRVEGYKFYDLGESTTKGYGYIWEHAIEDKTIYIKIDDDILYIHHDAIPQLVSTRLAQPHPYAVSAQLVNSPLTGIQQYHYGAISPFVPDPMDHPSRAAREAWRPSEFGMFPKAARDPKESPMEVKPPYRGHPWLLLSNDTADSAENLRTAMADWDAHQNGDIAFGPGWKSWAVGAQQQYSLLYNVEMDRMDRYFFGRAVDFGPAKHGFHFKYQGPGGEQVFDTQYRRYNLNFCAVWGHDIKQALPIGNDDEQEITSDIPRRLKRPFIIDTRSVVSHLSFSTQKNEIYQTDLVDRYRALANEVACPASNLKRPFDTKCPGY